MGRDRSNRGQSRSVWIPALILLLGLTSCQTGGPVRPSTPPSASTGIPTPGAGAGSSPTKTPVSVVRPAAPTPTSSGEKGGEPTATATPAATPGEQSGSPTPTENGAVPSFDHVYVMVLENKESTDVVGSGHAPYLNGLISQYGLATSYTGVAHPSQPNYLAIWAGSTFGVTDDGMHDLNGETLGDQLDSAGKTWNVYAENYPVGASDAGPACYTGASASGGEDGDGKYTRKHDPAMSFIDLNTDPQRCSQHITDLSHFDAASTDFSLIVPNACHDMHDCPVSSGDAWLNTWLPDHILDTQTWKETNSALFITWDEGDSDTGGGGTVPMIVISHRTPAEFTSPAAYDHYSLLATVEASWKLGCLRNACQASDLAEFFDGQ